MNREIAGDIRYFSFSACQDRFQYTLAKRETKSEFPRKGDMNMQLGMDSLGGMGTNGMPFWTRDNHKRVVHDSLLDGSDSDHRDNRQRVQTFAPNDITSVDCGTVDEVSGLGCGKVGYADRILSPIKNQFGKHDEKKKGSPDA